MSSDYILILIVFDSLKYSYNTINNHHNSRSNDNINNIFKTLDIRLPVHLLIQSRTGLGKSLLINTILNEFKSLYKHDLDYQIINSTYLYQENDGDTERYLTSLIKRNNNNSSTKPFILVLEEFDSISVKRESGRVGKIERGVTTFLLDLLDGNSEPSNVNSCIFIIGITNRVDSIDSEMFQCGRFDSVINIPIPSPQDRKDILSILIKKYSGYYDNKQYYDELIDYLANCTHGYVGADLQFLCNEAATHAIVKSEKQQKESRQQQSQRLLVSREDFNEMFHRVKPSILNQYQIRLESIAFEEIGALDQVIQRIKTAVLLPILNPEPLARIGIEVLARHRGFDSSTEQSADRLLSCLLIEMDGFATSQQHRSKTKGAAASTNNSIGSIVLGATTRIDMLDPTILRPGRFDYHIEIPNPDHNGRIDILTKLTKNMPLADDVNLFKLADLTNGCCGADLANLCKESALIALRQDLNSTKIEMQHFMEAKEALKLRTFFNQNIS
ncbi:AAA family ATPase [Heterostelium album PN500]|uniref:AAA family ATPase n=1 Tax=Heterostelium pallidum (strain ATCC 26659 / Pp 5 / PN500) TaxID=670386 RepID=D3BNR0_HETP5|nr:AAA family ATPase [Heterostelium album PN500]EFA76829.1 AAA family ATPase [Heterostelium album PN500]|eukprot:XP_020428961.1 AAA family ATPase [Heterostelium album PN500]